MENKAIITLFYVTRVLMALVGAFICWMWGYGIDNAIIVGVGYFLVLMFLSLEASDGGMYLAGQLYGGTLIALPLSYVFLTLFFGNIGDELCQEASKYCAMHLINR
jgi:fatty acid desaturase